jgi:hypothetical protein
MMNPANETAATLTVEIPNPTRAAILLDRWSRMSGISLNIVRGRITSDSARYQLEIHGGAAEVSCIVRQGAPWDLARRLLHAVPAGATA